MRDDPCAPDRCRVRYVAALGHEVAIPRHIVRLDGEHLAGWQVRFQAPSVYLSDAVHGGPQAAFEAACRVLRHQYRPIPKQTARQPRGGVRVRRDDRGQWFAEASHPGCGAPRRCYIGTDATRTLARERAARRQARAQRTAWLAERPVPLR